MNILKMICYVGFIGNILGNICKLIMVFTDETIQKRIASAIVLIGGIGNMYLFYYLLFVIKLFD